VAAIEGKAEENPTLRALPYTQSTTILLFLILRKLRGYPLGIMGKKIAFCFSKCPGFC
jgi:hypothetical protein